VKRRHRQSVVPAAGTAAEPPSYYAVDDDDDGPFVSKMKAATFQRRPPRTYNQCTHILSTKDEANSNLQTILVDFVACFCLFCVFGSDAPAPFHPLTVSPMLNASLFLSLPQVLS